MDTRKVTVISTTDQKRTVVETDATTLGELKSALAQAHVDYAGMTFYEAITRTELNQDESLLPHDVQYKGQVTNNLVFMLTVPNKRIKSGAVSETRVALYDEVVSGGYADAIYERYGKNFTNCSNAQLAAFLEEAAEQSCEDCKVRKAVDKLLDILLDGDIITVSEFNTVRKILGGNTAEEPVTSPYSDTELEELMSTMPENIY